MAVFTSGQYDDKLWEPVDLVLVTQTESVSIFRGIAAGIGGLVGGKSETMNKKMNDLVLDLKAQLKSRLKAGQMIVGVKFEFTTFGREEANVFISGVASGTLLRRKQVKMGGGGQTRRRRRT